VAIWDVATGERVFNTLIGHEGYVRLVNWSPDSKRIITADEENVIRIFDLETGISPCEPLIAHKNKLTSISIRPSQSSDDPEVISGV
jgi:WD40 repeat protein